jgi:dihydrolipoamide dehydrogenase
VSIRYVDRSGETVSETFDYIIAATGRTPNVHNLGLEHTGIVLDAKGIPLYDRTTMQCGASAIFIAGDVNNDVPLLHEAADEGRIAGENAASYPDIRAGLRRTPLAVVFTDPQIATVGARYAELPSSRYVTGIVSFEDQGRSRVMLRNRGLLHVYAEIGTGRLLGAEMTGPDAEHLAHLLAWAIQGKLTVHEALERPFYHPVVEEGLRTALRDAAMKLVAASKAHRRSA